MTASGNGPALSAASVQTLRDLITESQALRQELDADRAMWRVRTRYALLMCVAVAVMVGGLLTIVVQNRLRSNENGEILRRNTEISEQIADCTTAGGDCYERGQARTGGAIAELVRAQIIVEACGRVPGNDTAAEIQACVAEQMAKPAKPPR